MLSNLCCCSLTSSKVIWRKSAIVWNSSWNCLKSFADVGDGGKMASLGENEEMWAGGVTASSDSSYVPLAIGRPRD